MAERKAVNKYYPPDWDPRKGSVNKRVGQHPLRDRARKLSQGILVIRFELPYNIWCGGCGNHVGMGVRYNAEKSKVGNYYTTPIYKFRMKCHLCDNYFEIQTDPKNHDYVILSGARRKEQRWDPVANEQIVPEDKATQKKMAMDAMYKLEHGSDDKVKGKEKVKSLAELESSRLSMREDYLLNRMARDKFRAEKKVLKEAADADKTILARGALDIDLLEETESDRNLASLLKYTVTSSYEEKQKEKRKSIEQRPLFDDVKNSFSSSSETPSSLSSSSTKSLDNRESGDDSKHKLSETLKLARKDPFAIAKAVKCSALPNLKSSALGIRLKHSRVTKKNIKSHVCKKTVTSHLHKCSLTEGVKDLKKSKSDSVLVPSTGIENSIVSDSSTTFRKGDMPTKVTKELMHTQAATIERNSGDCHSQDSLNYIVTSSQISADKHPTMDCNSSLSNSQNASGLSMLMSSYDEGIDSDSNDSG